MNTTLTVKSHHLFGHDSEKEIVATFGFGGTSKSNLLCVYTYPQMQPILVNAACNLRILSATLLPDYCSVCATNDSTIRIYQLWEGSLEILPSATQRIMGRLVAT